MFSKSDIPDLNRRFQDSTPQELLTFFLREYEGSIALSSSLSIEDQALTHIIVGINPRTRIFTLDTGRLFPQTYKLIQRTNDTYGIKIEVFFPDYKEVERMVREEGINLFYNSPESRHRCCAIRKLEPLARAFRGLNAWICGLRHGQSVTRKDMQMIEWDDIHNLMKLNPLISWTEAEVREFILKNNVPYNKLFDQGYPSVGCEPCTRAVPAGADPRSGRWWWEDPDKRECGLHQKY